MGADADLVRRLTEEVYLAGNVDLADELLADDFVSHDPPPGVDPGKRGQIEFARDVVSAFDERALEFHDLTETIDGRVVENWAMTGIHSGEAFGVPPSGQRVRVRGVDIFRCDGGRVLEHWGAVDMSDFFEKATAAGG